MNDASFSIPELIARIRQGDEEAAAILVREYECEVRTEVRFRMRDSRMRRTLDSLDICQDILASFFVRVSLGQFDIDSSQDLMKILVRMARNKVADRAREQFAACRDQRRTASLGAVADDIVPEPQPSPADRVALDELYEKCRSRLSSRERRISELRLAGGSWDEIGQRLGCTPEAARKALERAFARISQDLELLPF